MKEFHVHIYRVTEKYEVDVEANDGKEARLRALEKFSKGKAKHAKSDCSFVAIAWELPAPGRSKFSCEGGSDE